MPTNPHTTQEWWAIDGVSLHQYGWNVATVGGSRYSLPPRRGDNIRLAYRAGAAHRRKLPDSRTINLAMWVTGGYRPNTDTPATDQTLAWNDSWDFLRRLVWKADGSQITLTRRWRLTVDGTPIIVRADALAEIADTMEPTMTGRTRADFVMTLLLADPFFYGVSEDPTESARPWTTVDLPLGDTVSVNNPGHDNPAYRYLKLDLVGPLTNPRITNTSPSTNVWVQLNTSIPAGRTVQLDVAQFTAKYTAGSTGDLGGDLIHSGSQYWMGLIEGGNALTLTADSGTGSAVVRFRPPYI